jgi:hypothetical protein
MIRNNFYITYNCNEIYRLNNKVYKNVSFTYTFVANQRNFIYFFFLATVKPHYLKTIINHQINENVKST